jgi:hypothetical protein
MDAFTSTTIPFCFVTFACVCLFAKLGAGAHTKEKHGGLQVPQQERATAIDAAID